MLEIQRIRENEADIIRGLKLRNIADAEKLVAQIQAIDRDKRTALTKLETNRAEMNKVAATVGALMKEGKKDEAEAAKQRSAEFKQEIKNLEVSVAEMDAALEAAIIALPNVSHPSVPAGKTPEDNQVVYQNNIQPVLPANVKPHWDLCKELNIIDWELGTKLTGAGFPVYRGKGAKLVRGLIQFFLDEGSNAGYEEIYPPLMVNEDSGRGTGQIPDKEGQMYHMQLDNLYMIPTAEVPITNIYRDVILEEDQLPIRNCGYTPCFRREAGSYGKDVRGLNRLHQFDKVEIVEIAHPDKSYERLEVMLNHAKSLLEKLELPYRVLLLCGGDMGFTSAKTFDLEVFSAAQQRWLEVSSVSCFETFQANRLKLRIREKEKKNTRLAHTLNGSALALPRVMAALMENNQTEDGHIRLPKVLHKYTGFEVI